MKTTEIFKPDFSFLQDGRLRLGNNVGVTI